MKRKFVCGIVICLALSVAGCGKNSEEQQAANYYQNELGLDKEEAEELAHELYGNDDESVEEPGITEEEPEETVIKPLPEIVNSEWYDRKMQILDMVFYEDDSYMTEEYIRKTVEESAYNVELEEGFDQNGNVSLSGLYVDGKRVALFEKVNYSSSDADTYGEYGLFDDGDYYKISLEDEYKRGGIVKYNKPSIEFEDFETRDDVLAYLAENGFVEVEKEQASYLGMFGSGYVTKFGLMEGQGPGEFADVPHYYCNGVQSITFYRIHKLAETNQVIEINFWGQYSGAHLNLINCVTFDFNTDGTIANITTQMGYETLGKYPVVTWEVEILGEQID